MSSQSEKEMDLLVENLQPFLSMVLVSVAYDEKGIQLRFENEGQFIWICFSLKPGSPFFFYSKERVFLVKNLKKPLSLFMKTHFFNKELTGVCRKKDEGRVILLSLGLEHFIKISLFPGGQNIELTASGKSVFAYKPKAIKMAAQSSLNYEESKLRDNTFFLEQWQKRFKSGGSNKESQGHVSEVEKEIKKKKKGLSKMREKLEQQKNSPWKEMGDWLKEHQSLRELPKEWSSYLDSNLQLSEAIEYAYSQHKKNQAKIDGTLQRIDDLEKEITQLAAGGRKSKKPLRQKDSLMVQSGSKGRTVELGEYKLYIGKSAKDNLSLLRRAKPWYLWLHIRDYPGAYGIIEIQKKNAEAPLEVVRKASEMVIQQSVRDSQGMSYQVLIAECRYVKPIKGAKSGQVTYSHEKVINIRV